MKTMNIKIIYLLMIGLCLASPLTTFSQQRQKAKTEEERQRELSESRRKTADESRGKYIPTATTESFVGKWRAKDGQIEIEVKKRVKEYKHLEFHFYHDVLDIEFTKFVVDGQEVTAFANKKFEFGHLFESGWFTMIDDPLNGNKMRFNFNYAVSKEKPDTFTMRYRQDPFIRSISKEKPLEIPDMEFIRVK